MSLVLIILMCDVPSLWLSVKSNIEGFGSLISAARFGCVSGVGGRKWDLTPLEQVAELSSLSLPTLMNKILVPGKLLRPSRFDAYKCAYSNNGHTEMTNQQF